MNEPVTLSRPCYQLDIASYRFRQPCADDYSILLEQSTIVRDATTGQIALVYLELEEDARALVERLHTISYEEHERTNGMSTRSRIFGYRPRINIRHDYCTTASLFYDQPETHALVMAYAQKVALYYKTYEPELYQYHAEQIEKILPDWRFEQTIFTSGIINKNNALAYHFDTGNVRGVWSNMLVFRDGTEGGALVLPEYELALATKHNSLVMFDGQNLLHGVTPILQTRPDGYRYSLVYYSLQNMWQCLPPTEEMARIRKKRTDREQKRLLGEKIR